MIKHQKVVTAPRATLAMGVVGAVIGGFVASARNYDKVKYGEMSKDEAVKDVIRESGTTGVSTAAGTAVMSALGTSGLISLAGMVFVAAGTKRVLDNVIDSSTACAAKAPIEVAANQPEEAEEKTTKKKTATKK